MTTPSDQTVTLESNLRVRLKKAGAGRPALILHGGAGPASVETLAAHLSKTMQTIVPTHPGWDGTTRPASLSTIGELAQAYLRYLSESGLRDVLVIGSSVGGWIAAEMAARDNDRRISGLVLIDAVGIAVDGETILNVFEIPPPSVFKATFHDAAKFAPDVSTMTAERIAMQRSNMAALQAFAGEPYMHDPALLQRLQDVRVPTLVLWGAADGVATPAYGRAYAAAFTGARFETIERAGHLPHIEQPAATFAFLDDFVGRE
jgi:pimeloyl-ACP methyl ester carboxylesterase